MRIYYGSNVNFYLPPNHKTDNITGCIALSYKRFDILLKSRYPRGNKVSYRSKPFFNVTFGRALG